MHRILLHPLFSWFCAIALAVGAPLRVGILECSDGHGGTHLEFSCAQNDRGECVKSCGPGAGACQESDPAPHPCEDKPLASGDAPIQAAQATQPAAPAPESPAPAGLLWVDPPAKLRAPPPRAADRPPDTLGRLRSIILTV